MEGLVYILRTLNRKVGGLNEYIMFTIRPFSYFEQTHYMHFIDHYFRLIT